MTKKVTGSDLSRLISEAMGLRVETDGDEETEDNADLERSAFQDFSKEDYDEADVLDLDTDTDSPEEDGAEVDTSADNLKDIVNNIVSFLHNKEKRKYYLRIDTPDSEKPGIFKAKDYSIEELNFLLAALGKKVPTMKKLKFGTDITVKDKDKNYFSLQKDNKDYTVPKREFFKIVSEINPQLKGERIIDSPWEVPEEKSQASKNFEKSFPNVYVDGHKEAYEILWELGAKLQPRGFLTEDNIFDFLSSGPFKKFQNKEIPIRHQSDFRAQKTKLVKWLRDIARKFNGEEGGTDIAQRALSLIAKTPSQLMTVDPEIARPDLKFTDKFAAKGRTSSIPSYVRNIFNKMPKGSSIAKRIEDMALYSDGIIGTGEETTSESLMIEEAKFKNFNVVDKFTNLVKYDFFKQVIDVAIMDPKLGGNVFENFMALLCNGTQEGGSYEVEDIMLPFDGEANGTTSSGEPAFISLKLLKPDTQVTQAAQTVNKFFRVHGEEAKIVYVLCQKDYSGRKFKFPFFYKEYSYSDFFVGEGGTVKYYEPGAELPAIDGGDTKNVAKRSHGRFMFDIGSMDKIATLVIDPNEKRYETFLKAKYGELQNGISDMYKELNSFEMNLTTFYSLGPDSQGSQRNRAGSKAEKNLENISKNFQTNIKDTGDLQDLQESKITPIDIKKIIEESFKR